MDYKPELVVTLDGAVQGNLRAIAATNGVTDFQSSTVQTRINGYRAIRTYASYTESGKRYIAKGVYLAVGQTVWGVQAHIPINEDDGTADRIIDSVALPTP